MSKKSTTIACVIIALLLIIAFISIFYKEKGNRVKSLDKKISENQNFTFSMEEVDSELNYKVAMAQRGTELSIDMYSEGEHTTTLILDDEAYYINHNEEEYYDFGDENVEAYNTIYALNALSESEYVSGREEILGKTYYYEEYDNDNMDFIVYAEANEESKIKNRFYFDGDELVYIKNIIINEEEQHEELLKTSIIYSVDDNLFEIPEEYAESED